MNFDAEIHQWLRSENIVYEGSKPSPQDWTDFLEENTNFDEEFKMVFNNADVPKLYYLIPEVIEDTYVDTEIALPRYG